MATEPIAEGYVKASAASLAPATADTEAGKPANPPEISPPPAAPTSAPGEITAFSGQMTILDQDSEGEVQRLDWGNSKLGAQLTARYSLSGPRVSGITTGFQNVFEVGLNKMRLHVWTGRLFTQERSWLETTRAYQDPDTTAMHMQTHLIGEGVYEGLTAIANRDQSSFASGFECHGVITEGGLPEFPSEAPSEIRPVHGTP